MGPDVMLGPNVNQFRFERAAIPGFAFVDPDCEFNLGCDRGHFCSLRNIWRRFWMIASSNPTKISMLSRDFEPARWSASTTDIKWWESRHNGTFPDRFVREGLVSVYKVLKLFGSPTALGPKCCDFLDFDLVCLKTTGLNMTEFARGKLFLMLESLLISAHCAIDPYLFVQLRLILL